MKTIATNLPDREFELFEKRVEELGISKSDYIKQLVYDDIGIKHEILKPKNNTGILNSLKKAFGIVEVEKTIPPKKEPKKEFLRYRSPNAKWKPSRTVKKTHESMKDREYYFDYKTGLIGYKAPNNTCYKCCYLNELLIIHEYNPVYRKDVVALRKLLKKHPANNSFAGLIYQYQEGMFDEIISNFKENVGNCKFKIYFNKLWFMGEESTISVSTAMELISIIENKGFNEVLVYKLCKSYPSCNEVEVRIVCENYNNSQLLNLLKQPNKNVVLNNPSKRRNMIRNNGVI